MVNRSPYPLFVRALALALSFLLTYGFAAGLIPRASAQSTADEDASAPTVATPGKHAHAHRQGFVVRKGDGATDCEVATPEDVEALFPRGASAATEMRQINHLGEPSSNAPGEAQAAGANGLTIILRGTPQLEANPAAKAGFIRAAAHWEAVIKSPITVVVDVDFGSTVFGQDFGDNVLGATFVEEYPTLYPAMTNSLKLTASSAAEGSLYNSLPSFGVPSNLGTVTQMFTPTAVLRALGELPPVADPSKELGLTEVSKIGFNSEFPFDFDSSNGVQSDQSDFDSVATHEIGHALGFSSQSGVNNIEPTLRIMSSWDIFRFAPNTANLGNFSSAQRLITSDSGPHVYFDGGPQLQLSTGDPFGDGGDGEQASHWKDDRFGTPYIGLMDPSIPDGVHRDINANDLRAADAFGYVLVGQTAPSLPAVPNDAFASAEVITTTSGTDSTNTRAASLEAGETNHLRNIVRNQSYPGAGGKSMWYKWTPAASGSASVSTTNSNYDTLLAVYRGTSLGGLTFVDGKDDDVSGQVVSSTVQFQATAGNTYYFLVDGFDGVGGDAVFNWNLPAAQGAASQIQLTSSAFNVSESGGLVTINLSRTGDTSQAQSVSYATSDGTAAAGSDYTAASGTATFNAGATSASFNVAVTNDAAVEANETFNVTISNPTGGATLGTPTSAVVTISNDDVPPAPSVQFSASTATVSEAAGTVTLTVTRTSNTAGTDSVGYFTTDGTATIFNSDYTSTSGVLLFAPGETSKSVVVSINNDTSSEPSETFNVSLNNPSTGVALGSPATAVVTITDNDSVPVNSVQFSTDHVDVDESVGTVTVTVTRTGDTSGSAEVGYSTANETANDRRDYLISVGTLRFAPGETSKNITVFVIDDVYGNGNTGGIGDVATESFVITLSNSVLASIGATPLLRVNIANNETADGVNPIRGSTVVPGFFARQHYFDFLNREADAPGLAFWTGQTTGCGNSDLLVCRINVSAAFFLSGEFQETGLYVIRAQRAAYGKKSAEEATRMNYVAFMRDSRQVGEGYVDGQAGAAQVLENNKQAYAEQIVSSGEFQARYAATQDVVAYVDALFATAGVTPTAAERQEAISAYNNAPPVPLLKRVAAFRKVTDSTSVRNAEFRGAFVLLEYFGYMRRDPDQVGYNFWLGKLNEFNGNYIAAELVKAFITSGEYELRFGP